jgi:NADH:ubiquinone oxidoreductase subunit F (NADH-binding)
MQWGIESNDTTNTFTNGTSATLQVKQGMGGYVTPSNTAVYESSDGNFGWYTTYSNGTMTMNRP